MNISSINSVKYQQPDFGSKNCPVGMFKLPTKLGTLSVAELDSANHKDVKQVASFIHNCSMESIQLYKNMAEDGEVHWREILHQLKHLDNNSTALVGKDTSGNVLSLFYMRPSTFDSKTGFVSTCLMSNKLRGQGLGKVLLERLISSAKGAFTDIILKANPPATSFYKQAGFDNFDVKKIKTFKNPKVRYELGDFLSVCGLEVPMTKSLDSSEPWLSRVEVAN